jgi:hypothetical protein
MKKIETTETYGKKTTCTYAKTVLMFLSFLFFFLMFPSPLCSCPLYYFFHMFLSYFFICHFYFYSICSGCLILEIKGKKTKRIRRPTINRLQSYFYFFIAFFCLLTYNIGPCFKVIEL